ncbi:MarR family winged helix-turn-helix transcriptional regulator [Sulfitobacter aestuariivivens]|uniref:MarR family winged helix-turn-helix transcriptional regulator n=1 Tax=Sulfitobacter aestuariivivens TaxID=2766981 RepID=UPI001C20D592|nr:MarR family winged helix-turn-helix transcriptional regulator [Sulfitobacter aestuariivivens]
MIPIEDVDDFIILRARAFTSKIRRAVMRDVLQDEDLALLEWQLLFSIARFGTCHLAYITQHTSLDPAHGSRAATALEKAGLIERHDDPDNRRRKLISLTPQGITTVERVWPRAQRLIRSVTDTLDATDFNELKRLFDLLNAAATRIGEGGALGDEQKQQEVSRTKVSARA